MASTSTSGRGEEERDPFLALQPPKRMIKSSLTAKQFDVFINHRGPDTKTSLAKPLHDSLQQDGIPAYLDFEETELGDYFPSAIRNAIFSATLHIAILSPRYAESAWCLAELALMFQTKARIIPLFYDVDPSDFRYIRNGVAEAFSKHEKKGRYPNHDIQQWKDCLQNVSGIMGYQLGGQNDDLNKLCNDIMLAVVKEKQKRKVPLRVAKHEVGLDELATDFQSNCQSNGEMRGRIIGIYGMGGSGKTTLAKYLFNQKHSEFSKSAILFDVRDKDFKGQMNSLQSKLLNDLQGKTNQHRFCSIEEGIAVINDYLLKSQESNFLIVIDDVDHQKQLDALLPIQVLHPKSLVIVTTRDERVLINAAVKVRYKMKKMNPEHSRELFCCHAFHRPSCKVGFENLVDNFVEVCAGLPLALQVMGGHVFGGDKAYWKLQLDVVKARLDKDIKSTLKVSYDSLEEDEKQVFMDIACFFIGEPLSKAMSVSKASGWRAEHALQTLKDKCLVEVQTHFDVNWKGCHCEPEFFLRMHDHLRDLGRAMADNEACHLRRLWRPQDHIELSEIKGFQDKLSRSEGRRFRCYIEKNYVRMCGDQSPFSAGYFLEISKTSTYAQWLTHTYVETSVHCKRSFIIIPELISLRNLNSLSLHNFSPATLLQMNRRVSLKLKELYCSFTNVPYVNEDMFINELASSFGMFKRLESLYLEGSSNLSKLNFEWNQLLKSVIQLTNLQTLEFKKLTVDGEIALSNTRADTIDDRFCMGSLEAISLCRIQHLRKVSIHGQFCPALKSLKIFSMKDLSEVNLTGVTTLESLVLLDCSKLRKLSGCNFVPKLEMFHIRKCQAMRGFPYFERASCLKRIYISHCEKLEDISAIGELQGLRRIWIADCRELTSVKAIEQLKGLKRIWIQDCPRLEGVICFAQLRELKKIFLGGCDELHGIQGIEYLIRLESIIITACNKLRHISGIEELEGLKEMIIAVSSIINYVQRLQRLPSELTILAGRLASDGDKWTSLISDLHKIGTLCEFQCGLDVGSDIEKRVKEMMVSFRETHEHSLHTLIFCAVVSTLDCPFIGSNVCIGTRVKLSGSFGLRHAHSFDCNKLYTCVVKEGRISKCESWMPSDCVPLGAFIVGVEAGEESKTFQTFQSVISQHFCDDIVNSDDSVPGIVHDDAFVRFEDSFRDRFGDRVGDMARDTLPARLGLPKICVDLEYDELAEHADEDEKYDGSDDGDD